MEDKKIVYAVLDYTCEKPGADGYGGIVSIYTSLEKAWEGALMLIKSVRSETDDLFERYFYYPDVNKMVKAKSHNFKYFDCLGKTFWIQIIESELE